MKNDRKPQAVAPSVDRSCDYDVVILGGAFSGAASGLLLKQTFPDLRVLVVERKVTFDRKVGESTSEVAGCFLTRVLNLGVHLSAEHIGKHGLRLWFHRQEEGPDIKPGRATESGPAFQGRLPAYQLNRLKLDREMLRQAKELGCEIIRPATVKNLSLGGLGKNSLSIHPAEGEPRQVTTQWVVDASGKNSVIPKMRKTWRSNAEAHPTSAMWTRFKNVCYLDSTEGRERMDGCSEKVLAQRTNSTNHLMGYGWWCWIIPLDNGEVSAGLTWDRRLFTPPGEGTMAERVHQHLLSQPVGKVLFEDATPVENDSRYYKNLAYYSEEVAGDGFAVVGDAAGFMDPLYSQGLDYCSHTVYSAYALLRSHFAGEMNSEELAAAIDLRNHQFTQSYERWFASLYKDKYYYLGDAELMYTAALLDISTYFIGPVRLVHVDEDGEFSKMPYDGPVGGAFAKLMSTYNRRLALLARKKKNKGTYGNKNLDHCYLISKGFSPGAGSLRLFVAGMTRWARLELTLAFTKPLPEAEPESRDHKKAQSHRQQNASPAQEAHAG